MRLWIDTDVGGDPDDAVALLCAAAHPEIDVVGVSTVDGDTEARAATARDLVDAPVIAGASLDPALLKAAEPEAVLAIGPLTTVARLIGDGVQLPRLGLMGGARRPVRHRRQMMAIEHNFGSDPAAAAQVIAKCPGTLICPLDVTARMMLDTAETDRLGAADHRLVEHLRDWERRRGVPVCLHDPLALLALVGEPVLELATVGLSVGPDGKLIESADGVEHEVVVDVDAAAAKARILALLEDADRYTGLPAEDERP